MVDNICRIASDVALRDAITAHNRSTEPEQSWPHVLEVAQAAYAEPPSRPPAPDHAARIQSSSYCPDRRNEPSHSVDSGSNSRRHVGARLRTGLD